MIIGAEIEAQANAEAAIELANAARGAALLDALSTLGRRERGSTEDARMPPAKSSASWSRRGS